MRENTLIREKPIANPLIVLREEFDDWAILFNPETAEAVGVNPTGVTVWKLIDGEKCLEEIVQKIEQGFRDVPDTVVKEVTTFVDDLARRGFVGYEVQM